MSSQPEDSRRSLDSLNLHAFVFATHQPQWGLHTRDHGHLPPEEHLVPQQNSADLSRFHRFSNRFSNGGCHYMSLPMCCMRVSRATASACSIMFLKFLRTALKTGLISFATKSSDGAAHDNWSQNKRHLPPIPGI